MTCTHCGAPSTQPSGPCATCAPSTAWPQPETDAPSGLVAPPQYNVSAATPGLEEQAPSGLPQFGGLAAPAPNVGDAPEYEPPTPAGQLPQFTPPTPADPHLVSQYSATLPVANAPTYAAGHDDTVPIPTAASVSAQYSAADYSTAPVSATAPVAAPYSAGVSATAPVPGEYSAAPVTATAQVSGQYGPPPVPTSDPVTGLYGAAPTDPTSHYNPQPTPTPQFAAPAPPYGPPSPYGAGTFPNQAAVPYAPAGPAASVLSIVAIALAAFAIAISFFVSPLVPAAGAVVCASIGLRRGERLARLGLTLGIVATVYGLGVFALNVMAFVLL